MSRVLLASKFISPTKVCVPLRVCTASVLAIVALASGKVKTLKAVGPAMPKKAEPVPPRALDNCASELSVPSPPEVNGGPFVVNEPSFLFVSDAAAEFFVASLVLSTLPRPTSDFAPDVATAAKETPFVFVQVTLGLANVQS